MDFNKFAFEVPPLMLEAHTKNVQAHYEKTGTIDGNYGLEKSGIAMEKKDEKEQEDEKMDTGEKEGRGEADTQKEGATKAIGEAVQTAAAAALSAAAVKAKVG